MSEHTEELVRLAREARALAYAPYSNFRVGAAVRSADGRQWTGANVENASYGLSVCAERAAVVAAVAAGAREIVEIAVASGTTPPVAPCGMCRQTLAEFARDLDVTLANDRGDRVALTLADLLPRAFAPADLTAPRGS